MAIEVRNLSKRYGTFQAVKDVSFEVPAGQLVALLGPSGSGKSTILRMIAGLETADTGSVVLTGEDATKIPVQERGVGFVFQHYALFRHMTVRDNIAFGLKVRKVPKADVKARVDELLELVQLTGYSRRLPSQLSGGQRQRVALARALAPRPKVLLLDEPFGALDAKVRDELRAWLRKLHDEVHVTSLFVTHDQREAFEVSDQLVVLNEGRVQQVGTPQELYERPNSPFVAQFLGQVNILPLRTIAPHAAAPSTSPGDPLLQAGADAAADAQIYVRPHDLEIHRERNGRPAWRAVVNRVTHLGGAARLDLTVDDAMAIQLELPSERLAMLNLRAGDAVYVVPRVANIFDPKSRTFLPVGGGTDAAL
ncbi:sulfate/molybdate ABC transporter ATP-binding protein [Aquisphaera giovannonii]|uniref:sulfate/molybdate ABC transporter ATP-binding protein n=1 Tax=Aquisphaera giovannonii TaxID=406548 RepID=UPI0011DF5046